MHASRPTRFLTALLWAQGVYFTVTGIWPILSITTFEVVTGPKVDDWLVQTVGALITVVGAVILMAAYRGFLAAEVVVLAVGSALALLGVDVIFVALDVIPPIYLLDAAAEVVLLLAWAFGLSRWKNQPAQA